MKRKFKVLTNLIEYYHKEDILIEGSDGYSNGSYILEKYIIENSPMFFEEIFDKKYETIRKNGGEIVSVQRLSDNKSFNIGDKFFHKLYPQDIFTIEKIYILDNGELMSSQICERYNMPFNLGFYIEDLEHYKEPVKISYSTEEVDNIILKIKEKFLDSRQLLIDAFDVECELIERDIEKLLKH